MQVSKGEIYVNQSAKGSFHSAVLISKANLHGFSYDALQMIAELFWAVGNLELSMLHQTQKSHQLFYVCCT